MNGNRNVGDGQQGRWRNAAGDDAVDDDRNDGIGGGATNSGGTYPSYEDHEVLLREFFKEHTVLVELQRRANDNNGIDSDDEDEEMFREDIVPGTDNCVRKLAYREYIIAIQNRDFSESDGSPVLQLPLSELVAWDAIRGRDLATAITNNAKRYHDIICNVVDDILQELPPPTARRHQDTIDILANLRLQQHAMQQEARAREGANNNNDINGPLGGIGLANDPANNQQQQQQQVLEAIPRELIRRYELRILPMGRRPINSTLGLNFTSHSILRNKDNTNKKLDDEDDPQSSSMSIRSVRSKHIGHLVSIQAVVVRASDVKPQAVVATYTCDSCGSEIYQPIHAREFLPLQTCPTPNCRTSSKSLYLQTRGSKFCKFQELKVQELSSQVPTGHVPRSMSVHCHGELTRQASPGDVIIIDGIFLPIKSSENSGGYQGLKSGLLTTTYLQACNIVKRKKTYDAMEEDDPAKQRILRQKVLEVAHGEDPVGALSRSIAPEIYGHEDVKRALLLQLVGGVERTLPDGMKIRFVVHD